MRHIDSLNLVFSVGTRAVPVPYPQSLLSYSSHNINKALYEFFPSSIRDQKTWYIEQQVENKRKTMYNAAMMHSLPQRGELS